MEDLRSLQHDQWKLANFLGCLLSCGDHFFCNGEVLDPSNCFHLLSSRPDGWWHSIQVVTKQHNTIEAARSKICSFGWSWKSKNNTHFLIPFWNAKSCNSRLPLVVWQTVTIVKFLALQTYFHTILGAFMSHLWITLMLQQSVCFFGSKIRGHTYDVRLMLVLGSNSYPVTDSDIYFVDDHSSGVVWIDPSW